jgi:phosphoribosylformylglycinamidine cyclo-ligase
MRDLTYKKSGVDIEKADAFKRKIAVLAKKSFGPQVLKDIGGFGSFFSFPSSKFKDPVLVSSADGVGTKLKIAYICGKNDTVGIDAVAMNVNDILCAGAAPLFFLDYIAYSELEKNLLYSIVKGVTQGCCIAGCSLVGGETAQMPGMYKKGEYDLAGFCVGAVDRSLIIDGSQITGGNIVIGLASSGLHSNGFSLVRKVFSEAELKKMSPELLKPTRIYVKEVLSLIRDNLDMKHNYIKGIAHITGGAFYDKIKRILPEQCRVKISKGTWHVPEIFRLIQNKGGISDYEMFHTFNMGIGMVLITDSSHAEHAASKLNAMGIKAWIIGEVIKAKKGVEVI